MPDNKKRGEDAMHKLDRELKSRDRKQKTRPFGVAVASLVVILGIAGGIYFLSTRDGSEGEIQAEDTSEAKTTQEAPKAEPLSGKRAEALPATVQCEYKDNGQDGHGAKKPDGKDISTEGTVTVSFDTTQGPIEMNLDRATAPCTTHAISELADSGFYDDTVCHRMTSGGLNVLQCGDPTGSGTGGPGFSFANEYPTDETDDEDLQNPVVYPRGSVAMANSGPDTNGSQFFLNYDDSELPPNYTYFGTITEDGLKTLDKIAEAGVDTGEQGGLPGGQEDGKPAEEVKIKKATVKA
ncbi:peptidylprolyl isomerase [Corynebacterium sp. KPL2680]|uniref:peptidylprolyl isomerase n=1 Tax=Corynebacterium sp. KPL2680 TaxID=3158310 RepID=UPI0032EB242D